MSGEAGYSTLERRWARPTFDITGLTSGYQQEGAKTVLPARASGKFSFRLVPNQDPQAITRNLRAGLEGGLAKLDLVTREEFDVQTAVLARTRQKLELLETQVERLERRLAERPAPKGKAARTAAKKPS